MNETTQGDRLMKKCINVCLLTLVFVLSLCNFSVFAAKTTVFIDQDFTGLRSGYVSKRGGVESIGAFKEDHFKFTANEGPAGLLANGDGYYVGFVTYKVSAPSNETIETLKLDLIGRIGLYDGEVNGVKGTAAQYKETAWMRIYVEKDDYKFDRENWTASEDKVAAQPELEEYPESAEKEFSFDLSAAAKGAKDAYVTIATYLECTPSWIGFSHLTLSGSTAAKSNQGGTTNTSSAASSVKTSSAAAISNNSTSSKDISSAEVVSSDEIASTDSSSEALIESVDSESMSSISASTGGKVKEGGSLWWVWLIVAVVVLAGAGTGVFFYLKKKNSTNA